jgi:hypothetical protein
MEKPEKTIEEEKIEKFKPGQRVEVLEVTSEESGSIDRFGKKYLTTGIIIYAGRPGEPDKYEVMLDEKGKPPITDIKTMKLRLEGRVTVSGSQLKSLDVQ